MGDVVSLIRPTVSEDTVMALEILLAEARAGQLVGIAYVGIYPARAYVVDMAGEAKKAPIFTLGTVVILEDQIARFINPAA